MQTINLNERILSIIQGYNKNVSVELMLNNLKDLGFIINAREIRKRVSLMILLGHCIGVAEDGYYIVKTYHDLLKAKEYRLKPAVTTIKIAEALEKNWERQETERNEKNQLKLF